MMSEPDMADLLKVHSFILIIQFVLYKYKYKYKYKNTNSDTDMSDGGRDLLSFSHVSNG